MGKQMYKMRRIGSLGKPYHNWRFHRFKRHEGLAGYALIGKTFWRRLLLALIGVFDAAIRSAVIKFTSCQLSAVIQDASTTGKKSVVEFEA